MGLKYNMSSILERTFDVSVVVIHIGYIAVAVGVFNKNPEYLEILDFWLKVFMAMFLLVRFNPFTNTRFTEFDKKVVFSTGFFLFTVTIVNNYLMTYIAKITSTIKKEVTQ